MVLYKYEEVAEHNSQRDLWIIIDKKVYDVTAFQKQHPGGAAVLLQMAGRDATEAAFAAHKTDLPATMMKDFLVGDLKPVRRASTEAQAALGYAYKSKPKASERPIMKRTGSFIDQENFAELALDKDVVEEVQASWSAFLTACTSIENAGEAIYDSLLESAPAMHNLFITPRGVQASRFVTSLAGLVNLLSDPVQLKLRVATLGFGHLHLDTTESKAAVFRDGIFEVLCHKLGDDFTVPAREGWLSLLNYIGGAIIYVRVTNVEHLEILAQSWRKANSKHDAGRHGGSMELEERKTNKQGTKASGKASPSTPSNGGAEDLGEADSPSPAKHAEGGMMKKAHKRTTFNEMFEVNAAVMGFRNKVWMREVLASFDAIVTHAAQSPRLQEECDVLAVRLGKRAQGAVNLAEYKACMLASLRSLLPADWDSTHEVAWNWLWDNVEQVLLKQLGHPPTLERALADHMSTLAEETRATMGQEMFTRFFAAAPQGQEHLKQSDMRLHFISEQVNRMTLSLFDDPWKIVDDISALGLRHVGYGVPSDLLGPFVTAAISVMAEVTQDPEAMNAYRWSMGLMCRILMRTINDGSTIVMKAVNANSAKQLRTAVACAPRKSRARSLLKVEAGSQSISPLQWAIESVCFEAARAIFQDLLTIRADRERYYYGVDELFERHPDIVHMLCRDAPQLLPTLLEGLVWRGDRPEGRLRRVNYYIKHLLVDSDGTFSGNFQTLVAAGDPKIMAHEVVVLVSDTLWSGVVMRQFIISKLYFIMSLTNFMLSQAILPKANAFNDTEILCFIVLAGRCMTYFVTMVRLLFLHSRRIVQEYRDGETMKVWCINVPKYLSDPIDTGTLSFALLLLLMLGFEPFLHCLGQEDADWPTTSCEAASKVRTMYSIFSMGAMTLHWFLLIDLAVFSTGLSVFCLVIGQVLSEIWRFIFALSFLLLTFGSAISVLEHDYYEMHNIPRSVVALFAITLRLYEDDYRDLQPEPALLGAVFMFVMASVIILLNLLVAQLNCSYLFIYQDMLGFARLNRAKVIVEMIEDCPKAKWDKYVISLKLDEPLEFNEGDVGLAGGIQVKEPASLHPVAADGVIRFGGSVSPDMQWPEEVRAEAEEKDKYYKLERLAQKTLRRIVKQNQKRPASDGQQSDFSGD